MQTVLESFTAKAEADLRRPYVKLMMSFDKAYDPSVGIFTLDHSLLDGPDLLAASDNDVIQEWDKFAYVDFSDRVISAEWSNKLDMPDCVAVAMADIVLDNHDGFFTPGSGSVVDGYVLPRRPLRLYAGFNGQTVPVFVGLTEKLPRLDTKAGTATFHCVDFLDSLFNRPLDESTMFVNKRTDEILADLLELLGLLPGQYVLDVAVNTIPFAYFEKGTKFGDAARKLMQAELGRLYMDELGLIRFRNRVGFNGDSVHTFNGSNTVSRERSTQDDVINVVEVRAKPRAVQDKQPIYQSSQSIAIPAGGSMPVWADFNDPVTSVDTPVQGVTSNTSYYVARSSDSTDAPLVTTGLSVSSFDVFATSAKAVIANSNAFPVYLTEVELWGTPAKVIGGEDNEIYLRKQDDDSVAKYDEHVKQIENDFLQSESEAERVADMILYRQSEFGSTYNLSVKGSPAFQLDDIVTVDDGGTQGKFVLLGQENRIARGEPYAQRMTVTYVKPLTFFVLDQSLLDGPDVLAI